VRRVAGIILTGGAGSRIGGGKAHVPFRDGTLLDAVIGRVAPQVPVLALNVTVRAAGQFASYAATHPLVPDSMAEGTGPLAGVVAGLDWLAVNDAGDWLATFPCDTPFLPSDLVEQLMARAEDRPVAARADGRLQGVCAVWPAACRDTLRTGVESGRLRSLHGALDALGGTAVDVVCEPSAFFNVNTAEDLRRAEAMALR
jgi:molybdenum cofactor guanylyltransferase